MEQLELASKLVNTCHLIHRKGLVSGSGGNISYRIGDCVYITPSGYAFETLKKEHIVCTDMKGHYEGDICPSKELSLHLKCYQARQDISAIIHVHSVYAVALSCVNNIDQNSIVPVFTPGYGARVGYLPVLPYILPGSEELANASAGVIANRNSVLLGNHGLLTVGNTLEQALNLVEEIEENAEIFFIVKGKGRSLTAEQIEALKAYR